jgi:hypothetical protein
MAFLWGGEICVRWDKFFVKWGKFCEIRQISIKQKIGTKLQNFAKQMKNFMRCEKNSFISYL